MSAIDVARLIADHAEAERRVTTDLDETRRLMYSSICASRTDRYNLAGTLINALVHHNLKLDRTETMEKVLGAIWGEEDAVEWALDIIGQLTGELDQ